MFLKEQWTVLYYIIQIKQLDNYKGFKREVNTFLLHDSFYTIEEFLHFEGI